MVDTVYIRLNGDGTAQGYRLGIGSGELLSAQTPAEMTAAASGRRVVLLLPAEQLLLTAAELPTRNRSRLLQALPYALEEQLASEVESLHFAVGRGAGTTVPVAVVARSVMDLWVGVTRAAGLSALAAYPDVLAVPYLADTWTVLLDGHTALVRTGPVAGFGLDPALLTTLLPLALVEAEEGRPARLRLLDRRAQPPADDALDTLAAACGIDCEVVADAEPALALLARTCAGATPAIDLLQGPYSRSEQIGRLLRPWRTAAALLGVVALLDLGLGISRHQALEAEDRLLTERIEQTYREVFPDAKKVVDPRLQMEQQLKELRAGSGSDPFVELLAASGPVLIKTPGIEIKAFRYKANELEVELTIGDFQALDRLKQALAGAGPLAVEVATASARESRVDSRVLIRRNGA